MNESEPRAAADRLLRGLRLADESLMETLGGALDPASPSRRHIAARRGDVAALAREIAACADAGPEGAARLSALAVRVHDLVTEVTAHELSLKLNHGEA